MRGFARPKKLLFALFVPLLTGIEPACASASLRTPAATVSASASPSYFPIQKFSTPLNAKREARINGLIKKMSLDEKVALIGGTGFATRPMPRLGIPALEMTDGAVGVRNGPHTAFPAPIAMAASFDPALIEQTASAIADESRLIGKQMLLGPCVGLNREPFGGRNFESYGEDPYLSSRIAEGYVKGIQERGVMASVKHFALNDQEFDRMTADSHADLRTMFEVHFPAYQAAINAGSLTVMTSYNMVNGRHSTESDFLQNQVLKKIWGFQGFIVSDWEATHSTIDAANAGLDVEMPYGTFFDAKLVAAVKSSAVSQTILDDKVRRLLRTMDILGMLPGSAKLAVSPALGPDSHEHQMLAQRLANESMVLLKNDGAVLPLDTTSKTAIKTIALIGPSFANAQVNGGGSSKVTPYRIITPLAAIQKSLGGHIRILSEVGVPFPNDKNPISTELLKPSTNSANHGLKGEYFSNTTLSGQPFRVQVDPIVDFDFASLNDKDLQDNFSVRWTGYLTAPKTGHFKLTTLSDDGVRLFIDQKQVIDNWTNHGSTKDTAEIDLIAGQSYAVRLEYYQASSSAVMTLGMEAQAADQLQAAVAAASAADVAVIFTGLGNDMESEGIDRTTMNLPPGQSELIQAIAAVNPKTVVVLNSGNPLTMSDWLPNVKAVVQAWYPGQEGGSAISDILTGVVNPSGKLPVSLVKRWEDSPAFGNYPGVGGVVNYAEGIFIGYRFYDHQNIEPNFPFGHGLSYTKFNYSNLRVHALNTKAAAPKFQVEFTLTNSGARDGAEVPQLYVGEAHSSVPRPVRELKGFKKIFLKAGQSQQVSFDLDAMSFAYFDAVKMQWAVNPDSYRLDIGTSSRDSKLTQNLVLQ